MYKPRLLCFLFLILLITVATAQIPRTLSYQGVLNDAAGKVKNDGEYQFTFCLYDTAISGTALWTEQKTLSVKAGLFSTTLGDQTPFGTAVKFDRQYWLGLRVGNEAELLPRIRLTSVGYSLNAVRADTAKVAVSSELWKKTDSNISYLNGYVGIGTTSPKAPLSINSRVQNIISFGRNEGEIKDLNLFDINGENNFGLRVNSKEAGYYYTSLLANGNEGINVSQKGYVGIGTTNPRGSLDIAGGSGNQMHAIITTDNDLPELKLSRWHGPNSTTFSNARIGFEAHPGGGGYDLVFSTKNGDFGFVSENMRITYYGNIGIGTDNPSTKLDVAGRTKTQVLEITGSDFAEPFKISHTDSLPVGSLVVIDPENPGQLKQATEPYDKRVAGVISGAGGIYPGIMVTKQDKSKHSQYVAMTGQVYALATAVNGVIMPGDLLTTSTTPGHAMKATDNELWPGAVIGKAMSGLKVGEGLVLVLVNLQ